FIEWDENKLIRLMGQPAEVIPQNMGIPTEFHQEYEAAFDLYLENMYLPLFEDVLIVLEWMKNKSIPLCIVTGAKTEEARQILEQNKIKHFFTEIIGADLTERGKPFPDPINFALSKLNLSSELKKVLFIGDSLNDLLSAQAAGVIPVLVWRKDYKIPENLTKNADIVIPNLVKLLDILE
ncbi:MAG: HAD family hydrolase, partial [Candidatus Hodarchaeota archaeon]